VGRAEELSLLSGWVSELAAGHGRAVLIEGEPGIGKSALMRAVAAEAGQRCDVFWGASEELGQAFPLLPLLEAFAVRETSADARRADIARALLGVAGESAEAAAERLLDLIDQVCAAGPAVLVVDDLQWADPQTVAVCAQLARSAGQRALLLLGMMRPVPRREDLAALRSDVGPPGLLRLGPLPTAAVSDLVAGLAGARPGPELMRFAEGAAGNPLYVTELVDALTRGERLAVAGGVAEAVDGSASPSLTEAILDRLDFLSDQTRRVVEAAALLGEDFSVAELATVLRRGVAELGSSLLEARSGGVLAESGHGLMFRHALIRQALYDDLPASARKAWHLAAAKALCETGAPVDRVARQLLPAMLAAADGHFAPVESWMVDWLVDVAPVLLSQTTPKAVELLQAAVQRIPSDDPRWVLLASRLAEGLYKLARTEDAQRLVQRGLKRATDPDQFTALHLTLSGCRETMGEFATSLVELGDAMAEPTLTTTHRARLLVRTCRLHLYLGQIDAVEEVARQVLSWARQGDDAELTAAALTALANAQASVGRERVALELHYQALAATEGRPDLDGRRLLSQLNIGLQEGLLDRVEDAEATLRQAQRLAERCGDVVRLGEAQTWLACLFFETGRWDDALAESALVSAKLSLYMTSQLQGALALIALHRGDHAAPRRHISVAPAAAESLPVVLGWLFLARALDLEHSGAAGDALAVLRVDATDLQELEVFLADAVRLAVAVGDQRAAAELMARAEALAAQHEVPRRAALVLHCRGLLARDAPLLVQAADGYGLARRPLARAQALEAAALVAAEGGDLGAARASFTTAWEGYAGLGATWDLDRMRSTFRRFGLRGSWTVRVAVSGWDALTETEAKVADLVASGLSNPEIAERLAVSRRTVESHVGSALGKLQLRSRVDIARVAADRRGATGH